MTPRRHRVLIFVTHTQSSLPLKYFYLIFILFAVNVQAQLDPIQSGTMPGRTDLKIYIVEDPASSLNGAALSEQISFSLSDQTEFPPADDNLNFDIESMAHFNGQLNLFTRNRTSPYNGETKWYTLDDQAGTHVAQLQSTFFGNLSPTFSSITAADVSPNGERLALLTRGAVYLFTSAVGGDFFSGDVEYNFFTFSSNLEGITFLDNCQLLIGEESSGDNNGRLFDLNSCDIVTNLTESPPNDLPIQRDKNGLNIVSLISENQLYNATYIKH